MRKILVGVSVGAILLAAGWARAQAPGAQTESLAKELIAAMGAAKIDSIATQDPKTPGAYVSAMNLPGTQLMVVRAKYPAPDSLDFKIANKSYRDVYLDLSAAGLEQKVYIEDAAGDGLRVRRRSNADPLDRAEIGGKPIVFDYDFKKQKMSLDDYLKTFGAAEESYSLMLQALIAQIKKG